MAPPVAWLPALRWYFAVTLAGNLVWEFAQMPLYTLWRTGSPREIAFAAIHCTGGDVFIAGASLVGSLVLIGTADWPRSRWRTVVIANVLLGVGYTAWSEHVNTVRGLWTYSDLMPLLPMSGLGLAPLSQWFVIPILASAAARSAHAMMPLDLPALGVTTSGFTPEQLARSDRRPS